MKKYSLLLMGVLVSASLFAGPGKGSGENTSSMVVIQPDASHFKVIYKGVQTSNISVEILDEDEAVIFSEEINHSKGFARPYNFDGLRTGEYTIKLNDGSNSLAQTIYYGENTEKPAHLIRLGYGKYMLTVAGQGEDVLSIRLSNGSDETINIESIPVNGNFAQVYDLRKVKGNFYIEVKDQHGRSKVISK